jgi:hypothetical protein
MAGRNHAAKVLTRGTLKHHGGSSGGLVHHAEVAPIDIFAKTGAKCLGAGLLGGESLGVGRRPSGAAVGFALLDLGIDALRETLAEALKGPLDATDVDDVAAHAEDHRPAPYPVTR